MESPSGETTSGGVPDVAKLLDVNANGDEFSGKKEKKLKKSLKDGNIKEFHQENDAYGSDISEEGSNKKKKSYLRISSFDLGII